MGLHASYYPIDQETLDDFIKPWGEVEDWRVFPKFEEKAREAGSEFYVGTAWHVLDFVINSSNDSLPELKFAVRGHEFPAPDGSRNPEPHMPSYTDAYWQLRTYVTADEVKLLSEYLSLIDEKEFNARFIPQKMIGIYHPPLDQNENWEYFELLEKLQSFYKRVAINIEAVLISIG